MANVVTTLSAIPVSFANVQGFQKITPVKLTLDTAGVDITVYTPSSTSKYVGIAGLTFASGSALSLTVKSASTTLVTIPLAANQMASKGVGTGDGIWLFTQLGEALIFNFTTAVPATALVYVVEFGAEGQTFNR